MHEDQLVGTRKYAFKKTRNACTFFVGQPELIKLSGTNGLDYERSLLFIQLKNWDFVSWRKFDYTLKKL